MYSLSDRSTLKSHISSRIDNALLKREEEYQLISDWKNTKNKQSLHKLITSHYLLLKKIAKGYSGYGICMEDLIAEGYLGAVQAANAFSIDKGFRFSTYLIHCVKRFLQNYVMKLGSILSISKSNSTKKLFFQLKRVKKEQGIKNQNLSCEDEQKISKELDVSVKDVRAMHGYIMNKYVSLQEPIDDGDSGTVIEDTISDNKNLENDILEREKRNIQKDIFLKSLNSLNKKEYEIFHARRLIDPPKKLNDIAKELAVSSERVRQIEKSAFDKIRKHINFLLNSEHKNNLVW